MKLGIRINKIPLELGQALPDEAVDSMKIHQVGLLRRLVSQQPAGQTVYALEDCELEGLDEELHIYPCTHSYLNRDRQWHTKATIFLKHDRLQRILFQVFEGHTAASSFLNRFKTAANKIMGTPSQQSRRTTCWHDDNTRVESVLHRDRINADFIIESIAEFD